MASESAGSSVRTPLPVIHLGSPGLGTNTANIRLRIGEEPVSMAVAVPVGATDVGALLPIFWGLTDAVVGVGVRAVERAGMEVSCRAGCGACCRQAVPISQSEARSLAQHVAELPETERLAVHGRFAGGVEKLAEAGLLEPLRSSATGAGPPVRQIGLAYFELVIACPFLVDESCSIHPVRPMACREYLVTSPAEECQRPGPENIRMVPLPGQVSAAGRKVDGGTWVPLILALEWAVEHPEPGASKPGPALLQELFTAFAGSMPGK